MNQIAGPDLDALISEQVREGKTIEYKEALPGRADADKREFLADASSFANTIGGDLLLGIAEAAGVPTRVVGFQINDLDAEVRRLGSMLESGLAPRIRYHIRPITHASGAPVLLLRVERSWIGPHRVIYKDHDKFFARNSAGKYALDVDELRSGFLLAGSTAERIRGFRGERILEIQAGRTPVPTPDGGKVVLHLLPLEAFAAPPQLDINEVYGRYAELPPIYGMGMSRRVNLDGLVTYSGGPPPISYVQLYRSGIIEAVNAYLLNTMRDDRRTLFSGTFEEELIKSLSAYLGFCQQLAVATPIYVFLSLLGLGAQGCWLGVADDFYDLQDRYPIDRDIVLLPEVVISDYSEEPAAVLRPSFDLIWNACGYLKSTNYDEAGNWKPRR